MSVTLKDVGSGYKRTAINSNFEAIEAEINNNLLSKNGGVGLEADLDANSQKIINLADGINSNEAVTLRQLQGAISGAGEGLIASQRELQTGADVVGSVSTFAGITYTVGGNNLFVFRNGNFQTVGIDYTETSSSSITWTTAPNSTDGLTFITNLATTNNTTNTSAITHVENSTNYNLATYLQNRHVVSVKDFGAVCDGVTDDTAALKAAIDACNATRLEGSWTSASILVGEGRILISEQIEITGLNVDFSRAVIILADNFPTSPAIIGHNLSGNAGATRDIKLSIDGNRANQTSTITAVGFTNFNWTGSHVHIHGKDCQTLLGVNGNTEGIQFLLTGFNIEHVVDEDINGGLTPDENEYKIITNTTGTLYKQLQPTQGTSAHLILNCEQAGQLLSADEPLIDITTNKTIKVEGLLRAAWATPVRVDAGTSSIIRFDLEVYGLAGTGSDTLNSPVGTVQALNVVECGKLFGFYEVHAAGDSCTAYIERVNQGGNLTLSNNVDSGIAIELGSTTVATNKPNDLHLVTYSKTSAGGKELVVNNTIGGSIEVLRCDFGIDIDPSNVSSSGGNYRTPISIPASVFVNDLPITTTDVNVAPWTGDITCHAPVTASLITGYSTPINGLTAKDRLSRTYYTYSNGAWTKPTMGPA